MTFILENTKACPEKMSLHCVNPKASGKKALVRLFAEQNPGLHVPRSFFWRIVASHWKLKGWK